MTTTFQLIEERQEAHRKAAFALYQPQNCIEEHYVKTIAHCQCMLELVDQSKASLRNQAIQAARKNFAGKDGELTLDEGVIACGMSSIPGIAARNKFIRQTESMSKRQIRSAKKAIEDLRNEAIFPPKALMPNYFDAGERTHSLTSGETVR